MTLFAGSNAPSVRSSSKFAEALWVMTRQRIRSLAAASSSFVLMLRAPEVPF